jgi:hypothetical protein
MVSHQNSLIWLDSCNDLRQLGEENTRGRSHKGIAKNDHWWHPNYASQDDVSESKGIGWDCNVQPIDSASIEKEIVGTGPVRSCLGSKEKSM